MELPIVCTLTPDTVRTRRAGLLPGLAAHAETREPLPDGYRLAFVASSETLSAILRTIDAERQCCRFLTFTVTVNADGGVVTVDLSGPSGTREFLDALLDDGAAAHG
jgi:hypothetical protein